MDLLKQKKGFLLFLIILLAAGLFFFLPGKDKPKDIYSKQTEQRPSGQLPTISEADTDKDGLKDWEEVLWGTDPNNADSDGDTTKDGDEVLQNRNPAKTPPDYLSSEEIAQKDHELGQKTNLTEYMQKSMMAKYFSVMAKSGGDVTDEMKQALVEETVQDLLKRTLLEYRYTLSDIKKTNNGEVELKKYAESVAVIYKDSFEPYPEKELTILKTLWQANEEGIKPTGYDKNTGTLTVAYDEESSLGSLNEKYKAELEQLAAISEVYKRTGEELIAVEVPENMAENHLLLANSFYQVSEELNDMTEMFTDPIKSTVSFQKYLKSAQALFDSVKNIYLAYAENSDNEDLDKLLDKYSL